MVAPQNNIRINQSITISRRELLNTIRFSKLKTKKKKKNTIIYVPQELKFLFVLYPINPNTPNTIADIAKTETIELSSYTTKITDKVTPFIIE